MNQNWRAELFEETLNNGLQILVREIHSAPVVSIGVFYRVGSYHERPAATGVSHWIEHLLFQGTPHTSQGSIAKQIRQHGGTLNAQTSPDYTCYFETVPKEHIGVALKLEAERMRNSCYDPDAFEHERQIILSELDGLENSHMYHLRRAVQSASYLVHPYRNPVIGWRHDIENLSYDLLFEHYDTYYVPSNALVVIVGDVVYDQILDHLNTTFGKIPKYKSPHSFQVLEPPQQGQRRIQTRRPITAAYLSQAYHIPAFGHPDTFALRVLEGVLGYGHSGRLYQALVESDLATSAAVSLFQPRDPGLMFLGATIPNGLSTEKAESALSDTIHRIQQNGTTEEELNRSIRQREMSFLYAQDSVSYQTRQLGAYAMLGSHRYLSQYLGYLSQVTGDDVQRVAQTYLVPENCTTGLQLPGNTQNLVEVPRRIEQIAKKPVEPTHPSPAVQLFTRRRQRVYHQLKNGMQVVLQQSTASPIAEVQVRIRIGGNPEPPDLAGVSTLTAHLLKQGTKTRTAQQISAEIEQLGASMQMQGSVDSASASLSTLVRDLSITLPVLADVLQNPVFPRREVRKQRELIRNRLEEEQSWPTSQAYRALYSMIYPEGHPYRHTMGVDRLSIENIRPPHLRQFHRYYYRPECATLVLVANADVDKTLELVEACFGGWQGGTLADASEIPEVELPARIQSKRIRIPDKSQVEVLLGHIGIARKNPNYHQLTLMNHILSGFGGRLYQRIREDLGLAYGVCSSFAASLGAGPFVVHLGTRPEHVELAVDNVLREIRRVQQTPVEHAELEAAKRSLVGNFVLSMQTHAGIASALLTTAFYGLDLNYLDNYRTYYDSIASHEIQDVARRYLYPDRYSLAIAGPQAG